MTLQEFLDAFKLNVEADVGDGVLSKSDIQHMFAVFEELQTQAAQQYLPQSFIK